MPNKRKQALQKDFLPTSLTSFSSFNKSQTRLIKNINTADLSIEEAETIHRLKKIHDIKKLIDPITRAEKVQDGSAKKIDIQKLRDLCVTKHGLVNEELRRKIWPLLLNANIMVETSESLMQDSSWKTLAKPKHRDSDQIEKDINRSLNTFEECRKWNKSIKEIKRE